MKYYIITLFLLFTFLFSNAYGQEPTISSSTSIPIEAQFITSDKLQHIYIVTLNNTIIKFTPDGNPDSYREQYRFSNNTLGELAYIDATDPFNLLLYYPDYQLIIILDRTLNKISELSLLDANVIQVNTIGLSNDGNVWVYDEAAFLLKKLNKTGEILVESQNLSLLLPQAPKPIQIIARENFVYLNDPALGILVFNNFGQYVKLIPIQNITNFQILDNQLIYKENNVLRFYNLQSFRTSDITLPQPIDAEDQVQMQQGHIYIKRKNRIDIYLLK